MTKSTDSIVTELLTHAELLFYRQSKTVLRQLLLEAAERLMLLDNKLTELQQQTKGNHEQELV